MNQLIEPRQTEPLEMFFKGFVLGLQRAGRPDLILEYPAAESAAAIVDKALASLTR
jgi:hypothetical protein